MHTPLAVTELLKKAEVAGLRTEIFPGSSATVRDQAGRPVVEFAWLPTVAYVDGQRQHLSHVARLLDELQVEDVQRGRRVGDVLIRIDDDKDYDVVGIVADPLFKQTVNYVVRRHGREDAQVLVLQPAEFYRP